MIKNVHFDIDIYNRPYSYVKLYLSQRKKGVSAISKSVRNQYLEFLAETGMTRYEFSKLSGIPESTLWSLGQKEDYDVRESNIRKIAKGMGVPANGIKLRLIMREVGIFFRY